MKQSGPIRIIWAAFGAAIASTLAELLLWWIRDENAIRNLFRDARLAAAIVMGRGVLGPHTGFDPLVMGAATLVHFSLSLAYTTVLTMAVRSLSLRSALLAGTVFGLILYGINMHGLTTIFPWFIPVRGVVTLVAHLVFGITAAAIYKIAGR